LNADTPANKFILAFAPDFQKGPWVVSSAAEQKCIKMQGNTRSKATDDPLITNGFAKEPKAITTR